MKGVVLIVALVVGTIMCAPVERRERSRRAAVGPMWPTKKIPYAFSNIIDFDFEERAIVKSVLRQIEESLSVNGDACIQFVERTNEKDYMLFVDKGDCSSGIGFVAGLNHVSLNRQCLKTGSIIHEVLHRLGFDDRSSRVNSGNHNVFVHLNNTVTDQHELGETSKKAEKSQHVASSDLDSVPYDYHSMINHRQPKQPPVSMNDDEKPIVLMSEGGSDVNDYNNRHRLSPLDIFKIQRFYDCRTLDIPEVVKVGDSIEADLIENIEKRFKLETELKEIESVNVELYLKKTHEMCGVSHFWPLDYPLVTSSHRLYKLMCTPKRALKSKCKLSIECADENSVCFRPLLLPTGYCTKFQNERLNDVIMTINDSMVKIGKRVKSTYNKMKTWIKNQNLPSISPQSQSQQQQQQQ